MGEWISGLSFFEGCTKDEILNFIAFILFFVVPAAIILAQGVPELILSWKELKSEKE